MVNCSCLMWILALGLGDHRLSIQGNGYTSVVDKYNLSENGTWLSCEFSWHPRILIVAHSSAVFLIDIRSDGCIVSCLLRAETLVDGECMKNDQFVAFSKACSDTFILMWLQIIYLLCDLRKPLLPLLHWSHSLAKPNYITVFRLSELRSNSREDDYGWASDAGYGILMGTFRNCEFGLFCFGQYATGCGASEISKIYNSFYAWELRSELQLRAGDCHCGSCLINKEFCKGALPDWTDWRQKREVILGFGILDKDLFTHLSPPNGLRGFMLIRLTSCGKLESKSNFASWEYGKASERAHNMQPSWFEDSLLHETGDTPSYRIERNPREDQNKFSFGSDFHENVSEIEGMWAQ